MSTIYNPAKNVMIDLETAGTRPGSAILVIGACTFDAEHKFVMAIDFKNSQAVGYKVNMKTLLWWDAQDPAIKAEAFSGVYDAKSVLSCFSQWLGSLYPNKEDFFIWGNGADFDQPMLTEAYEKEGLDIPWNHRNSRCYRTLKALLPNAPVPQIVNNRPHNALHDALFQAQVADALMSYLHVRL